MEGKIILAGEFHDVCIGIDDGLITVIGKDLKGDRHIDMSRHLILPGGVDVHTHMREPGFTHKEDFYSGTMAAALGGTTTILDMPNTNPPANTYVALEEKMSMASWNSNVDFGLYAGLMPSANVSVLAELALGYKVYMACTTNAPPITQDEIAELMASDDLAGKVVAFHAEDPLLFGDEENTGLATHDRNRSAKAENSAIQFLSTLDTKAILHVAHVTNADGLAMCGGMSTEVSPHHLFLNTEHGIQQFAKVLPPVRGEETRHGLFNSFAHGKVGIVASDHAPHTLEEKGEDFPDAPAGLPGVETRIPLMLAMAKRADIPLGLVQETCCRNPAQLFNIPKGQIELGYDADLAVYDMGDIRTIRADDLHYKCGWTPLEGHEGIFPKLVMLHGEIIAKDGEMELERIGRRVEQRD